VDDLGLSLSQIKCLQLLDDADRPLSLKAIGDRLGLSLPAASRAVDGLVKRHFVTRQEDPLDRRRKRVLVTEKGRRTFEELMALRVAGLRDFLERLAPGEREALADGLRPLACRPEIAARLRGGSPGA
jgi:DNA-binding MarR family transcriptional regulator